MKTKYNISAKFRSQNLGKKSQVLVKLQSRYKTLKVSLFILICFIILLCSSLILTNVFNTGFAGAKEQSNETITLSVARIFSGWNQNSNLTYNISYVTDGGEFPQEYPPPTTYESGNTTQLPTNITKVDARFCGWYDNAELSGDAITEISPQDTGDKIFYAKWENAYAVSGFVNFTDKSPVAGVTMYATDAFGSFYVTCITSQQGRFKLLSIPENDGFEIGFETSPYNLPTLKMDGLHENIVLSDTIIGYREEKISLRSSSDEMGEIMDAEGHVLSGTDVYISEYSKVSVKDDTLIIQEPYKKYSIEVSAVAKDGYMFAGWTFRQLEEMYSQNTLAFANEEYVVTTPCWVMANFVSTQPEPVPHSDSHSDSASFTGSNENVGQSSSTGDNISVIIVLIVAGLSAFIVLKLLKMTYNAQK